MYQQSFISILSFKLCFTVRNILGVVNSNPINLKYMLPFVGAEIVVSFLTRFKAFVLLREFEVYVLAVTYLHVKFLTALYSAKYFGASSKMASHLSSDESYVIRVLNSCSPKFVQIEESRKAHGERPEGGFLRLPCIYPWGILIKKREISC